MFHVILEAIFDRMQFSCLTPLPGCEDHAKAVAAGVDIEPRPQQVRPRTCGDRPSAHDAGGVAGALSHGLPHLLHRRAHEDGDPPRRGRRPPGRSKCRCSHCRRAVLVLADVCDERKHDCVLLCFRAGLESRVESFQMSAAPSAPCDHRTGSGVTNMQKATSTKGRLSRNVSQPTRGPGKRKAANSTPLNFKVPEEFRREFKIYAAQHNMKLNQVLFDAFAALKEKDAP